MTIDGNTLNSSDVGATNAATSGSLASPHLSAHTSAYLARALELGALDGPVGDMHPNPRLAAAIDAFHCILAGGEVTVAIANPGSADVRQELDALLAAGIQEANEINVRAGYCVTAIP